MIDDNKILRDAKKENDYMKMKSIEKYVNEHKNDFDDPVYLLQTIHDLMEKRFMHPDCSQIEHIYLIYPWQEPMKLSRDKSMTECSMASETFNEPLADYLYEGYDIHSFRVEMVEPSDFERNALDSFLPTMEERKRKATGIRRGNMVDIENEEEPNVRMDYGELFSKYQQQVNELIDDIKQNNKDIVQNNEEALDRIMNEINRLRDKIETLTGPEPKEIIRYFNSKQFNYFLKHSTEFNYPFTTAEIGKNRYQVTVKAYPENEQKIHEYIEKTLNETKPQPHHTFHSPGYNEILDILCRVYEKESGRTCGLSRTGALSGLAERIASHAAENNFDWQEFDIGSMDLFAQPGKIYTAEQASEAFDTLIQAEEYAALKSAEDKLENQEALIDEVEVADAIVNYDAIVKFEHDYPTIKNPKIDAMKKDAIRTLTEAKFYPNKMKEAREAADSYYSSYLGADIEEAKQGTYNNLVVDYVR